MVFKFDTRKNLLRATASGSLFVDCASPAFEVFFKPWSKSLYLGKGAWLKLGFKCSTK